MYCSTEGDDRLCMLFSGCDDEKIFLYESNHYIITVESALLEYLFAIVIILRATATVGSSSSSSSSRRQNQQQDYAAL